MKYGYQHFKTTFQSIFRSTSFLTFNALSTLSFFCFSRHLAGKFYLPVVSHLPAMISSFLAIKIERENRRSALAFYCLNIAMETIIFGNLNVKNNVKQLNRKHNIIAKVSDHNEFNNVVKDSFLSLIFNIFKMNNDEFKKLSMYVFGVTSIIYLTKLNTNEQKLLEIEYSTNDESKQKKIKSKKEHLDLVCLAFKYLIGEQEFNDENKFKKIDKLNSSLDCKLDNLDSELVDNQTNSKRIDKKGFKKEFNKLFSYSHQTSSQCLSNGHLMNCLKGSFSCSLRGFAIGFLSNFTLIFAMHLKNNQFKMKQSFSSLLGQREKF